MSFKQTQESLRRGYNYTHVEVKYDLNNLILLNIILQSYSKKKKKKKSSNIIGFQTFLIEHCLLSRIRLKIAHYIKHVSYMLYLQNCFRSIVNVRKKSDYHVILYWHILTRKLSNLKKKVHLCIASKQLFPTHAVSFSKT